MSVFHQYLKEVCSKSFQTELRARIALPETETHKRNVQHFTEEARARKRDKIVMEKYLGKVGINTVANEVTKNLQKLRKGLAILDVGAGTGLFTVKIARKLANPYIDFYALDMTFAMLYAIAEKLAEVRNVSIRPLYGFAERISESTDASKKVYEPLGVMLPSRFDTIISILTLHHCENPFEIFNSMKKAMKYRGKLILVDLCKHNIEEYKEMGDVHLGFEPDEIRSELGRIFSVERVEKIGVKCKEIAAKCKESGDLFIAVAENRID